MNILLVRFLPVALTLFWCGGVRVQGQSFLDRMNEQATKVVQKQEQAKFIEQEKRNPVVLTPKTKTAYIKKDSSAISLRLQPVSHPATYGAMRQEALSAPKTSVQRVSGGSQHFTPALAEQIVRIAREEGVDPLLVLEVMRQESGFKPWARSSAGARGLMQFTPGTARRFNLSDPHDPEQAIRGGCQYLRFLLKRFGGQLDLALAGYNAGEARVDQYGGVPPFRETRNYVVAISAAYGEAKKLEKAYLTENFGGVVPTSLTNYRPEYTASPLTIFTTPVHRRRPSRAKRPAQKNANPSDERKDDWVFRTKHATK